MVNREAKKAKEKYLNNTCIDIDFSLTKDQNDKMYTKIILDR